MQKRSLMTHFNYEIVKEVSYQVTFSKLKRIRLIMGREGYVKSSVCAYVNEIREIVVYSVNYSIVACFY